MSSKRALPLLLKPLCLLAALPGLAGAEASTIRGRLERHGLAGTIPVSGVSVTAVAPGLRPLSTYTGYDGMYYIYNVSPGKYNLEIRLSSQGQPSRFAISVGADAFTDIAPIDVKQIDPFTDPDYRRVVAAVQQLTQVTGIRGTSRLADDLGLDSTKATTFAALLEQGYKVQVDKRRWSQLKTIDDVVGHMKQLRIDLQVYSGLEKDISRILGNGGARLYVEPNIPAVTLRHAKAAAKVPTNERVLGLVDLDDRRRDALVFGATGLYFHNGPPRPAGGPSHSFIRYPDFARREFVKIGAYSISLGNGEVFDSRHTAALVTIVGILQAIKSDVKARLAD